MVLGMNEGVLGNAIDDMSGQPKKSASDGGTRDTFDKERWTAQLGSNLEDGTYTKILEYEVESQTEYQVGHGSAPVEETLGRWASRFYDSTAAADVTGSIRVVTDNANGTDRDVIVSSIPTSRLQRLASDKRAKEAVEEKVNYAKVGEDSVIQILFSRSPNSSGQAIDWTDANTETAYDMTRFD